MDRQTIGQKYRLIDRQTDGRTERQRQTIGQKDRQTEDRTDRQIIG